MQAQEGETVAIVNGIAISKAEFYEFLAEEFGTYALQELIQRELLAQKAATLNVDVTDEQFAEVYAMIIAQVGGPEALQMFLMQNNATEAQFIEQIRMNLLLSELAAAEVEVTEEALLEWFEVNRNYYDRQERVEVSHILVDTEEEAQEILAALNNGSNFAELAQEKSLDPGTAWDGGYLGEITKGLTVAEFEETAFGLAVDEIGLANSTFGWHIITLHSRSDAEKAQFADIADLVERDYRSSKSLDTRSYLSKIQMEADLEVLWPEK